MEEIQVPKPITHTETNLIRSQNPSKYSRFGKNHQTDNKIDHNEVKKNAKPLKSGVKKKELGIGEKIKRSFIKEDVKDLRDYVILDLIIPSIQRSLFDTIIGTISQIFGMSPSRPFRYSDGYSGSNRTTVYERQYRDYTSIQRENRPMVRGNNRISQYDRFYVNDYIFTYKEDAESVLEQMMSICDSYGWVDVATFFELSDPDGTIEGRNAYTNNNFGWSDLNGVSVKFEGSGYLITLPPAKPGPRMGM